jgi:hypothetical protein
LEIKKQMVGDFTHEFLTLLPLCKAILKLWLMAFLSLQRRGLKT